MHNVLIVNLNLAVDKTAVVEKFRKGRMYRLDRVKTFPGGKGVNVARSLKSLGTSSRILGFVAGFNGKWIADSLAAEGLGGVCVPCGSGESRICYSVVDGTDGVSTDFNEEGPRVPAVSQKIFLKHYRKSLSRCDAVAICGRISAGLKKDFYGRLVRMAKKAGKISAFDTSGAALREGIAAGAAILKMNKNEFREASGFSPAPAAIRRFFRKVSMLGTKLVFVTDGPFKAYAVTKEDLWILFPVKIGKITSPVGAGDSFMAGFLHSYLRKMTLEDSFRLALGTAASDCLSVGAGMVKRFQCLKFARRAKVGILKS